MSDDTLQELSQETARRCGLGPFGEEAQHIYHALQQAAVNTELRQHLAEQLMAVVFSLRPDDAEAGQAFALSVASTAMARSILATVGPAGDAEPLLALAAAQVRTIVTETQSKVFRDRLAVAPGRNN